MAGRRPPVLSFGVPVRNGERWVADAVGDLLQQTVQDVEVVVCDNASTDGTPDVLAALAAQDGRVRLHRNPVDLGVAGNVNRVLGLARAPLFAWAAADDRHDPAFAERTMAALQAAPSAVGATVGVRRIGPRDEDLGPVRDEPDLAAPDPAARLRSLVFADQRRHAGHEFYGLWRRQALQDAGPMGAHAHADRVLLVRLVLRGPLVRVPQELFRNRDHGERSTRQPASRGYRGRSWTVRVLGGGPLPPDAFWDRRFEDRIGWPEWRQLGLYRRAVEVAPLTPRERRECRRVLAAFAVHQAPKLTRDVLIAAEHAARRAADRSRPSPRAARRPGGTAAGR